MIFCCYDCKISTYEFPGHGYVSPDFEIYDGSKKAIIEFLKNHKYHKVSFQSDAHGQLDPEDFMDWEKK